MQWATSVQSQMPAIAPTITLQPCTTITTTKRPKESAICPEPDHFIRPYAHLRRRPRSSRPRNQHYRRQGVAGDRRARLKWCHEPSGPLFVGVEVKATSFVGEGEDTDDRRSGRDCEQSGISGKISSRIRRLHGQPSIMGTGNTSRLALSSARCRDASRISKRSPFGARWTSTSRPSRSLGCL
jgi:hypothetical protein